MPRPYTEGILRVEPGGGGGRGPPTGPPPAAFLTDRLGSRRVLFYAFAGATVSLVLVGLSPNEWVLAATLALLGFCIGLYPPAGLSPVAQGVRQRGTALGFHGVSGN